MERHKSDIFESLANKLEEKEFEYNASHWEAAEKMIPSSNASFWSPKWIAGISSAIVVSGVITYNLFSSDVELEKPQQKQENVVALVEAHEKEVENVEKQIKEEQPKEEKVEKAEVELPVKEEPVEEKYTPEKVEEIQEIPPKKIIEDRPEIEEVDEELDPEVKDYIEKTSSNTRKRLSPNIAYSDEEEFDGEIVEEQEEVKIEVPNIFTPNGDGLNDYFEIKNLKGKNWSLFIFTMDNKIVFQSSHYRNNWDGGDLEEGEYSYKLYNEKTKEEYTGILKLEK